MKVLSTIPWVIGGLVGGGLWITPGLVWAQPLEGDMLLAQQIVDGLPPPPPLAFGQEPLPAASASQFPSSAPAQPTGAASRYLVLVNGDSSLLLSQVQALVPNASVQEYNGQRFIQAGTFSDASQAQQQVSALATQGIGANILAVSPVASAASMPGASTVPSAASGMAQPSFMQPTQQATAPLPSTVPAPDLLPVTPVPREVEFGQPPDPSQLSNPAPSQQEEQSTSPPRNPRYYFIVIPGNASELPAISNQVVRLGGGVDIASMVQTATTPRGPHVQVGPFVDRNSANRWTNYFRDFGLKARVYYQR